MAHGIDHLSRQRGMTLVEVMMVVFIIGLSAGLVVLTLPARDPVQLVEARDFAQAVRTTQDAAILSGQPTAIQVTEDGYFTLNWSGQDWTLRRGGKTLPRAVDLVIRSGIPERPEDWPQLIFDPTGVNAATEFRFAGGGERVDVLVLENGEVQIEAR